MLLDIPFNWKFLALLIEKKTLSRVSSTLVETFAVLINLKYNVKVVIILVAINWKINLIAMDVLCDVIFMFALKIRGNRFILYISNTSRAIFAQLVL